MTAMGESEAEVLAWCVVANVAEQTSYGEDAELRRGLKHFAAGAKLWVLPPQWGDGGEHVFVVGRHRGRGPGKLVRMVVERRHLTNYRVRGIYSQTVYRELTKPWASRGDRLLNLWQTKELAEDFTRYWNRMSVGATEVRRPGRRIELLGELSALAAGRTWAAFRLAGLDPRHTIGEVLRDDREAEAVAAMLAVLQPMIADLGTDHPYDRYAEDPRWTVVVDTAAKTLVTLTG
jgi:hypothetical protein